MLSRNVIGRDRHWHLGTPSGGAGPGPLRAQRARRRGAGHDRRRHRVAGDHAGGAVEKTTAMVNRYGERLLARRSGAAQPARLQQRGA